MNDKQEQQQRDDAFINEFCDRLQQLVERSPLAALRQMGEEGKDNLRALAEAALGRMNVVSRAEFDAQNAILAQAVEKLAQIEAKLEQLEQQKKPPRANRKKTSDEQ